MWQKKLQVLLVGDNLSSSIPNLQRRYEGQNQLWESSITVHDNSYNGIQTPFYKVHILAYF